MSLQGTIRDRDERSVVFSGDNFSITQGELLACRAAVGGAGTVAISIRSLASLARVLFALDGHCAALLLLSDSLPADDVATLAALAGAATVVSDREDLPGAVHPDAIVEAAPAGSALPAARSETAWLLTTSGTTGTPKIVRHSLAGLMRTVRGLAAGKVPPVWGMTYEASRFAGLQVLLQAACGGGRLVVPPAGASTKERVECFARLGVTHVSATPTLWRQVLMNPEARRLDLQQATLGGEIADQPLLDAMRARFPAAKVTHIYASTEAGVGFSVQDGREGFPRAWLRDPPGPFRLKLVEGMLWVRSLGQGHSDDPAFAPDDDGYVNTFDRVEEKDDRIVFLGRATGAVNVGGVKVYPEVVERVLNENPQVAISHVTGRKNPFSGAILTARIVPSQWPEDEGAYKRHILRYCGERLSPEAVPAMISLVQQIELNASGKLGRK